MTEYQEIALEYQKIMLPYATKAEKEAKEVLESLEITIPRVYEQIPPHNGMKDRVKRFIFYLAEK